jgi:hypothetical protein
MHRYELTDAQWSESLGFFPTATTTAGQGKRASCFRRLAHPSLIS